MVANYPKAKFGLECIKSDCNPSVNQPIYACPCHQVWFKDFAIPIGTSNLTFMWWYDSCVSHMRELVAVSFRDKKIARLRCEKYLDTKDFFFLLNSLYFFIALISCKTSQCKVI